MARNVRTTLLALGTGAVFGRLCQLLALACIAHALGVARTGLYAQGLALGAVLAVLAGAGIRNHVAREVARAPETAGSWIRAAVRGRLLLGAVLTAVAAAVALACSDEPWFWILCAALVLPSAFDLKGLLDAADRTRLEVAVESGAGLLHLGAVVVWARAGGDSLAVLALLQFGCRCVYALGAAHAVRRLPAAATVPSLARIARSAGSVSVAQTASELATAGDVWVVGWIGGDVAAGLYAVAQRIAAAASLPSAQLARLLLPHFHRSASGGDPTATTATALRSTAWMTLPFLAGGMVVAEPLCTLLGADFAGAGNALRLMLLATTAQHLGWQCSHALFALGRDRAYARTLLLPALVHAVLLPGLVAGGGATGGALSAALAQVVYLLATARMVRGRLGPDLTAGWSAPVATAAFTGAAALAADTLLAGVLAPLPALVAGAGAFAVSLHALELRGRWGRVGEGLSRASGFGA